MSRSDADGQQADVGVIGLGHMGDAFAQNLMADGHRVMVFDRRSEIVDALAKEGAIAAAKVQDFAACKIVLTSLPDDDAVASVTDALIPALGRGAVHVSTSTISAGLSRRLTEKHRACHQGLRFLCWATPTLPITVKSTCLPLAPPPTLIAFVRWSKGSVASCS